MPERQIDVPTGGVVFTTDEDTVLITHGISTCIAFLVLGSFWDEEEDEVNFCGIHHWSGFINKEDQAQQAQDVLRTFLEKLRFFAGIEDNAPITIDMLGFIGGEKEQRDLNQALLLSGTEAEVRLLKKAVKEFDFAGHQFIMDSENIVHQHFLTTGTQKISLKVTLDEFKYKIKNSVPECPNQEFIPRI